MKRIGHNDNVLYKGKMCHVQTQDICPNIITEIYIAGTVIGQKKTSYADIQGTCAENEVVVEIMREQHGDVIRSLKDGKYQVNVSKPKDDDQIAKPLDEVILDYLAQLEED